MDKNSDCHEALDKFVKDYCVPDSMIYFGKQEHVGQGTKFQYNLRKYGIHGNTSERESSNKTQQKALFGNCTKNDIKKCLEHTIRDDYGATETHTLTRLCY